MIWILGAIGESETTNKNDADNITYINKNENSEMIEETILNIITSALHFLMSLHNKASITKNQVISITNDITKFLFEHISPSQDFPRSSVSNETQVVRIKEI